MKSKPGSMTEVGARTLPTANSGSSPTTDRPHALTPACKTWLSAYQPWSQSCSVRAHGHQPFTRGHTRQPRGRPSARRRRRMHRRPLSTAWHPCDRFERSLPLPGHLPPPRSRQRVSSTAAPRLLASNSTAPASPTRSLFPWHLDLRLSPFSTHLSLSHIWRIRHDPRARFAWPPAPRPPGR